MQRSLIGILILVASFVGLSSTVNMNLQATTTDNAHVHITDNKNSDHSNSGNVANTGGKDGIHSNQGCVENSNNDKGPVCHVNQKDR